MTRTRALPAHPVLWNYNTTSYKDNFVDPKSFLERLTLAEPTAKSYRNLLLGALHIANHVCLVVGALVGTWISLAEERNKMDESGWTIFALEAGGYLYTMLLYYRKTSARLTLPKLMSHLRQAAILTATVVVLSPIYATLTASISSDSIIALIIVLTTVHLYLHDYSDRVISHPNRLRSTTHTVSLSCGMCASVLASTMMPSRRDVVAATLLALEVFLGSPFLLHALYAAIGKVQTSVLVGAMVLGRLPTLHQVWLLALLFVIVVLCPMWMVRIDKYKAHIGGPWDEAAPVFDDD